MQEHERYRSVARSHQGLVRAHNEDSHLESTRTGLWAVADGMGGLSLGEVASQAVVRALGGIGPQVSGSGYVAAVKAALEAANAELRELATQRGETRGIGSTVAGLIAFDGHFAAFWSGDSRVYRLRDGDLDRLTRDHSLVQDMVDSGLLAPDRAESHPMASVITHAVGVDRELRVDFVHARIQPGDLFLICSDGLTRVVADGEIERVLQGQPMAQAAETLLAATLDRGAPDNVTLVLVACQDDAGR